MTFVVTAPQAYVKTDKGTVRLELGATVPDGVDDKRLDTLLEAGSIKSAPEPQTAPAPPPAGGKPPRSKASGDGTGKG